MKIKTLTIAILLLITPFVVAQTSDPCAGEDDKITCIETFINQQRAEIESRIAYLNSTPGPKGEKGIQGNKGAKGDTGEKGDTGPEGDQGIMGDTGPDSLVKGPTGNKGPEGEDRRTLEESYILEKNTELKTRYVNYLKKHNNYVYHPIVNQIRWDIEDLRQNFSRSNRNVSIMKFPASKSPILYDGLDWPRDANGVYLQSFKQLEGDQVCTYSISGGNLVTSCSASGMSGISLSTVCQQGADYNPAYCSKIISGSQTDILATTFEIKDYTLVEQTAITLPTVETNFQIISMNEWANYKLGLNPDDPIYLMALDRMIEHAEDPDLAAAIIAGLEQAKTDVAVQVTLLKSQQASNPEYASVILPALNQYQVDATQSIENSIIAFNAIADPATPQRRLRMGEFAMDSDLMFYYLVETVIGLYIDYRQCQFIGQLPPTLPVSCDMDWPLSADEADAFALFEDKLIYFTGKYIRDWQNLARNKKIEYFSSKPNTVGPELFGDLNTPNFIEDASDEISNRYLESQSEDVKTLHQEMAAGGVFVAGSVVAAATGAYVSAFGIGTATTTLPVFAGGVFTGLATSTSTLTVGSALTGSAAAAGATTSVSIGGAIAAVAGPVAIISGAVALGVVGTIKFLDAQKQEEAYNEFMAFDTNGMTSNSLLELDHDTIANIMYMWLMLDAPEGVANSPEW